MLSGTLRARYLKLFEEIGDRHTSMSMIMLGKLDEAETVLRRRERRGTMRTSERTTFTWNVRMALLSYYRGDLDKLVHYCLANVPLTVRVPHVWFLSIYLFHHTQLVRPHRPSFDYR